MADRSLEAGAAGFCQSVSAIMTDPSVSPAVAMLLGASMAFASVGIAWFVMNGPADKRAGAMLRKTHEADVVSSPNGAEHEHKRPASTDDHRAAISGGYDQPPEHTTHTVPGPANGAVANGATGHHYRNGVRGDRQPEAPQPQPQQVSVSPPVPSTTGPSNHSGKNGKASALALSLANSGVGAGGQPLKTLNVATAGPVSPGRPLPTTPTPFNSRLNAGKGQPVLHVTTRAAGASTAKPQPHALLQSGTAAVAAASVGMHSLPAMSDPKEQGRAIEQAALSEDYCGVVAVENAMTTEELHVCYQLLRARDLRAKWLFRPRMEPQDDQTEIEAVVPSDLHPNPFEYVHLERCQNSFRMEGGVIRIYPPSAPGAASTELYPLPGDANDFFKDMHDLIRLGATGPVKTYCHQRLTLLEQRFSLHQMLNADKEFLAQKIAPHRDFYNVRKVDTHVHHSACMHQKHLLRFIKGKLKEEKDEIVIFRDGKFLTLAEVFQSLKLEAYDLNVDTLDMHVDKNIFHRFDRFNLKYNPFGQSRLREIFIKQDNLIHGRYLAELTKEVFRDLEETKYQHTEYRISIYGRKTVEWDILAAWVCQNKLYSDNNVWLIQVPRLYHVYKAQGLLENFEQMLTNIFLPLFEVTHDPATHPQLHIFLNQVVGFDCVDDESKPEYRPTKNMKLPPEWNTKHNPAYSYYLYYLYANLFTLNKFREERGLNTFSFRPHCGEAGELDHLASAFMACENISHGILLRKSPFLQYMYYLAQIGLCMSPLSNNSLFLDYHRNPMPMFFARGLSVSLSTDDPLQIHLTKEPLVEEYSVAANMWKLASTDLCEIARNGVLHSGFPHECKKHWLGKKYWEPGPEGNDIHKTNVPNLRMRFRYDAHQGELMRLYGGALEHAKTGTVSGLD